MPTEQPSVVDDSLAGLAVLADPLRRRLYQAVVARRAPVTREEISHETGLAHHVVKFNLDRLAAGGLLEVEYRRPPGQTTSGRPTKWYRRSGQTFEVSLPARRYESAGRILATAVQQAQDDGVPIEHAVRRSAAATGHSLGRSALKRATRGQDRATILLDALSLEGFEPEQTGHDIVLRNCPFDGLVADCPRLICHMNLDMVTGLLEEVGANQYTAIHQPEPDTCCVRFSRH